MLQTTSSMPSWLNWSTIAAAVCLCNFICPVRSGDFGLVLLFLRNVPSESFCLMGLSRCILVSYFLLLFYRCIYLSTPFNNVVSMLTFAWTCMIHHGRRWVSEVSFPMEHQF